MSLPHGLTILAISLTLYAVRLAGLFLPERRFPPGWRAALGRFPVALFAALLTFALAAESMAGDWRLLAAVALSAGITWRSGRAGLGLFAGVGLLLIASLA